MKVLFTTEGTYPSVMGGVSTWCDQLLNGLAEHEFEILQVTGPVDVQPAYKLPRNVKAVHTAQLWRPRRIANGAVRQRPIRSFEQGIEELLGFAYDDTNAFAAGMLRLARAGTYSDLWPLFDRKKVWDATRDAMTHLLGREPTIAALALSVNWLRATLAPLLYVPGRVDYAHSTSNGLSAIPAWLASQEHGVPFMLTEHGLYLRERYLGLSTEGDPPGMKLLRARFYRNLAQLNYTDSHLIVSVSEFNRAWQIELGAPASRTRVVYNGVAPEAFPYAAAKPVQPTVSWVGRIDPIKDLETLIHSFEVVKRDIPDAKLRLFGPVPKGNEGYYGRLEALVTRLQLRATVAFEGPISPVHQAYHAADVVALSSVSEGFPYVAIEAMMCGKPVVATSVGGVGEALGAFGRLVEPRDATSFGQALNELLGDEPLRLSLGEGARSRALSQFTLDQMYQGYRRLYGELTSTRGAVVPA